MSIIKKVAAAYEQRQARRWDEAAREQARRLPPEPWQCSRCSAITAAHLNHCSGCGTHIDALGYWAPIY